MIWHPLGKSLAERGPNAPAHYTADTQLAAAHMVVCELCAIPVPQPVTDRHSEWHAALAPLLQHHADIATVARARDELLGE